MTATVHGANGNYVYETEGEEYYEFVTQNLTASFNRLRPHVDFYRTDFSGSACARLGSFEKSLDKYGKNVQLAVNCDASDKFKEGNSILIIQDCLKVDKLLQLAYAVSKFDTYIQLLDIHGNLSDKQRFLKGR